MLLFFLFFLSALSLLSLLSPTPPIQAHIVRRIQGAQESEFRSLQEVNEELAYRSATQ